MKIIIFIAFALFLQGALGELVCEELPVGVCSFSVASSGNRCLLETSESNDGTTVFQCKTSDVVAMNLNEYIETEECVTACGVERESTGISSDYLLESQSSANLCSPQCYQNCPNIVDLYYNLAIAEGVFLPELCKAQTSTRRSMAQFATSGAVASGPISGAEGPTYAEAPTSSVGCPSPI